MSRILPPNAGAFLHRVANATWDSLPVNIEQSLNPASCPESLLPWLAWEWHVDNWDLAIDEQTRRAVIRDSAKLHRLKGTRWAVQQALATLRVKSEITEWWQQQPPGEVHTFGLTAWVNENLTGDSAILSAQIYERLRNLINDTKPVRSHYELKIGARFDTSGSISNAQQVASIGRWNTRPSPVQPPSATNPIQIVSAADSQAVGRWSSVPVAMQPPPAANRLRAASVARSLIIIRTSMEAQ